MKILYKIPLKQVNVKRSLERLNRRIKMFLKATFFQTKTPTQLGIDQIYKIY